MKVLKKNIYFILVLFLSTIFLSACKDDKSDTEISRMFRPISLELISGTKEKQDYIVSFPSVRNAAGYTLRISTSADFSTDVEEFPIDPVASSTVQYTITNSMLSNRTDLYDFYITVKAKSKDGQDYDSKFCTPVLISPYRQNLFSNRKKEFLFTGAGKTDTVASQYLKKDEVTFKWDSTQTATNILVKDTQGKIVTDYPLTDTDRSSKKVVISGLTPETNYVAFLYEGTLSLGRVKFTTTSPNEKIVSPGDGDLQAIIDAAAPDAVLRLTAGDYTCPSSGPVTINKNITIQSFEEGVNFVNSKGFLIDGALNQVKFKGINVTGSTTNNFLGLNTGFLSIQNLILEECNISTFKSLVNSGSTAFASYTSVKNLTVNRCIVSNLTGSAASIDLRQNLLYNCTITNSTFYNNDRGLILTGTGGSSSNVFTTIISDQKFVITNNTFYNICKAAGQHFINTGSNNAPHIGSYLIAYNIFANTDFSSTGGFYMCGATALKYNNFYKFKVRTADVTPIVAWGGSPLARGWSEISNNFGDVSGLDGYSPQFIDVTVGNFIPKTKTLNTLAPGGKPVGAPYWVN